MALNSDQKQALTQELNKQKFVEYLNRERVNIDDKNKFNNLSRLLNWQKHEEEQLKAELVAKTHEGRMEQLCERECNFAREMEQIKQKELKDMLMRQHLRENCPELRELERQLKLAYTNKQLAIQIAEKRAEKLSEKIRIKQERESLRNVWETQEEFEKKLEEEENLKKYQYKKELQDQMILKEKQKRYMYDEFLKEKKLMDDIVERIYEEDQRNMLEKMRKMQRTREEMDKFKQAQEIWKKKKKEELELENQRIQEYLQTKATDIQTRLDMKKQQEAAKEAFCLKIARDIFEEQQKIKERDEILQDLLIEEQREAIEKRHRDDMEKQFRQRIEMQQSLERQVKEREEKLRSEIDEDRRYKQQLLDKAMEDERIDRLTAEKKRIRMLQMRKDIEEMMAERRQKRAEEMQMLKKLQELEEKEEENRQRIIEEERIRMLQQHIDNLDGFIPKGLIKPSDLPYLSHRKQDNEK